ncbi:hypothetical protein J6590_086803 [Homalodisca vitripennis]|nr:hypothetical protein J6590_086803 [Homalodisca vitripennis]
MAADFTRDAPETPGSEVSYDTAHDRVQGPHLPRSPCQWQLSMQLARNSPAAPPRATDQFQELTCRRQVTPSLVLRLPSVHIAQRYVKSL